MIKLIALKKSWRYGFEYFDKEINKRLCCCDPDIGDQEITEAELRGDGYTIQYQM